MVREIIEHLFYYCRHSKNIWVQLENWFKTVDFNISFDIKTVIFGCETGKYAPINLMILAVKNYIFQQSRKDSELSFSELKKILIYQYTVEKNIYSLKAQNETFEKLWSPFKALFE